MQKNSVKQMIQQLGEDYWFEIYSVNDLVEIYRNNDVEPIVDGRECYNVFENYYNEEVQKIIIDFPNDEELQVIKLFIK
jgi:hypothetical protein